MASSSENAVTDITDLLFAASVLAKRSERIWAKCYGLKKKDFFALAYLSNEIFPDMKTTELRSKQQMIDNSIYAMRHWISRSSVPISDFSEITYLGLRDKVANLMSKGLSTHAVDVDYFSALIAIFWDFECCRLPDGYQASELLGNIRGSLTKLKYKGSAQMFGYGCIQQLNRDPVKANQIFHTLEKGSIKFVDDIEYNIGIVDTRRVDPTSTDTADKRIITHINEWIDSYLMVHHEGAVLVAITGDVDLRGSISMANKKNIKTVLAFREDRTDGRFKREASKAVPWLSFIIGEIK